MVEWTTHDPCLVFSESDSKLYTNIEFRQDCEVINVKLGFQSTKLYLD